MITKGDLVVLAVFGALVAGLLGAWAVGHTRAGERVECFTEKGELVNAYLLR